MAGSPCPTALMQRVRTGKPWGPGGELVRNEEAHAQEKRQRCPSSCPPCSWPWPGRTWASWFAWAVRRPQPLLLLPPRLADMHMEGVTIAYGMTETSPVSFQTSTEGGWAAAAAWGSGGLEPPAWGSRQAPGPPPHPPPPGWLLLPRTCMPLAVGAAGPPKG